MCKLPGIVIQWLVMVVLAGCHAGTQEGLSVTSTIESTTSVDSGDTSATSVSSTTTTTTTTTLTTTSTDTTVTTTGARVIDFAGRQWWVKSGYGGPGPNDWSDSKESVWVDEEGGLHLVIREIDGLWHCAEIYTTEFTQYGMHRFYVDSPLDELDKNAVFAPFLYANDETEVDIEFTRWGNSAATYNAQYVVQPYNNAGNMETFSSNLEGTYTTHSFDWQAESIQFKSMHGHYKEAPSADFLIHQWLYEGEDNPREDESLRIHINLWLYQGVAPASGEEVSVIVRAADLPE